MVQMSLEEVHNYFATWLKIYLLCQKPSSILAIVQLGFCPFYHEFITQLGARSESCKDSGLDSTSWVRYEFHMEISYGELYETLEPHIAHYVEANS